MKNIHFIVEDKEYKKMRKAKELQGNISWKIWILQLATQSLRENLEEMQNATKSN